MTVGSLFSGIGGIDLGLERAGMKVLWQCEIDPFCRRILRKHWPNAWIFKDVKTILNDEQFLALPKVDLICGGFPCQPFSAAGRQRHTEDPRDLWPRMFEIVRRVQPSFVMAENVYGFYTAESG